MSRILKKLDLVNKSKKEEDTMLSRERSTGFDSFGMSEESGETVLSSDVSFKGSIKFKNTLRIDGKFEGDIASKGILCVGKSGEIKAEIKVGTAVVEGVINGNITAEEKIELKSTAQLFGDIKAARIAIAEGVTFVGKCNVNPSNERPEISSEEPVKKEIKEKKEASANPVS
ncbi:polymer-forming cytoskeletal protein [Candidatus Auribacterota bacterium]